MTCDNAENNTTMLKEMHVLVPKFRGTLVRVQCFGHVLNLVVKVSCMSVNRDLILRADCFARVFSRSSEAAC